MVWYNPVDDIKDVVKDVRQTASGWLAQEVADLTRGATNYVEVNKYGTASKIVGDSLRGAEKVKDDLSFGNIWDAVTDVGKTNGNVFHDIIMCASGKVPTTTWDWGQKLEASLSTNGEGSEQFKQNLDCLNSLWDGSGKPPGYGGTTRGDVKFYDDNAWVGIALMDACKQNPNNLFYLERAKQLFDLQDFGTQGTDNLPHPGGVFWTQKPGDPYRAAVSTAGAAQLALLLYGQTKDSKYLNFAKQQFDWVNKTLKDPNGNDLFSDGIGDQGQPPDKITTDKWSYNQGLMMGDAVLLSQATGDSKYIDQAQLIAKNSLAAFGQGGKERPFINQDTFFNAVFFKNLMLLDSVKPDNSYRQALNQYAGDLKKQLNAGTAKGIDSTNIAASAQQVFALANKYPPSS